MSNFAAITQVKNQKDGNNYPLRMEMWATLTEIGGVQATQNGKNFAKCKLKDDQGVSHNVTIYNDIPPVNLLNSRHVFSLSSFDGNYNGKPYVGYSGFWQHNAGGQQAAPPQRQQAPPRQTAQANKDDSIERQCAWKSACTVAASSGKEFALEETLRWAAAGLKFIETGEAEFQEDTPAPDDAPAPTDDDIPF